MMYTLIPLCLIFFFNWQLEKHDNKYLVRHIKFLEALREIQKVDLSDPKWDDYDENGEAYWEQK